MPPKTQPQIESWLLERPIPYARNARVCPESAIAKVAGSIKEFGFKNPILVDGEGVIIAGHTRLLAAQRLGLEVVPVVVAADLSPAQVKAYRLADNRTAQETSWDYEMLEFEMADLEALDYDVSLTGFEPGEWLPDEQTPIVEDEVPEPPEEPITKLGDLWLLGEHRVLCGDATKGEDVARLMDGRKADVCLTDPPYGVGVDYASWSDTAENVDSLIARVMPSLLKHDVVALTPGIPAMWSYPRPTWLLAWVHPAPSGGCPWGFGGLNPILVYGADPYLKRGLGRRPDHIVLTADREGVEGHPCPKPVKVWAWLLERVSPERGESVYDPFLGSGTTLIAAEQTGRICYGVEIDPRYCDVIVKRWEAFTGESAERQPAG